MGMFDQPVNSSDARFEAPDPSRFEAPAPPRSRAWGIPLVAVLIFVLRFELHSVHGTGWVAAAAGVGAIALAVAEIFLSKKRRDERQSELQSSSQHITR